jgi:hypothetical protein
VATSGTLAIQTHTNALGIVSGEIIVLEWASSLVRTDRTGPNKRRARKSINLMGRARMGGVRWPSSIVSKWLPGSLVQRRPGRASQ